MSVKPKYRTLTTEELHELEKEFVDFLVVNGITADQWVKIKEGDKPAAEDMIVLFSDVVMEGVLRNIQYLEIRARDDIKTFQCLAEKIVLVGLRTNNPDVNFLDDVFLQTALQSPPKGIEVYTTYKAYKEDRQQELFRMIQSGCQVSDGKLFKALSMTLA
ncbi:MAG: DUF6495 family protein [Cyclobacteriaceae bacterium]